MLATVKVYKNTGFNGVDIPASASVLNNAASITYNEVYYIREDIDKPAIRIKDTYENLVDIDYCSITANGKTSYFYAEPFAIARGVTGLALDLDALLTMGGASNLDYISGWQERGHIARADDVLFGNIAAEDWMPSQTLECKNMSGLNISTSATQDANIIISNVALYEVGQGSEITQEVIEGIANGQTEASMYFPLVRSVGVGSETPFAVWDFTENNIHQFYLPNTAAFNPSNTVVKNGLQKLFSCGQLQLQNSYKIPKEYLASDPIEGTGQQAGRYGTITGMHGTTTLQTAPFEYSVSGYTPKNKKVFSTYRNYVITNLASGDMSIKEPSEIYDGSTAPAIELWADPCSTGKPYARFSYIKGNTLQYADCVRGLQWNSSQLVMEGASGSVWNSIDTAFQNRTLESGKAMSTFEREKAIISNSNAQAKSYLNAFNKGTNVGSFISSLGGSAINAYADYKLDKMDLQIQDQLNNAHYNLDMRNANQAINQNGINLLRSNNVVAPSVSFTPEQNLGLYGYNKFVVYEIRKSEDDLKSEDMYYQKYGYNGLHRKLTAQCFNERQYYNFVQATDINIKASGSFGRRVREKAIAQLNGGVRVWKVLPDASYYETN